MPASETMAIEAPPPFWKGEPAFFFFIEVVIAGERRMDVEMGEELLGVAGVFRGDDRYLFQDAERPEGDVFEIADRGADDVERSRHGGPRVR